MASAEPLLEEHNYVAMDENGGISPGLEQVDASVASKLSTMRHRKWSHDRGNLRDLRTGDITETAANSFFAWGRDFESLTTPHKFLSSEKEAMARYASNNYFPQNSEVYRNYILREESKGIVKNSRVRWLAIGLIGFIVGLISVIVRQTVDVISSRKFDIVEPMLSEKQWGLAWLCWTLYSCAFVGFGALLVLFVAPAAASSGIPEVIAFLNGVHVPKIFNIKTLVVKLVGVICSVGSGLPVGPEGPMIHMGGMVGAGVSQGRSASVGYEGGLFDQFRNVKDRRDFITAGVATGVSAAFGSPVGGLLFAMEEVASFWSIRLGWTIFFGCMVSVFVSDLMNSALEGWDYIGHFGAFDDKNSILYKVTYDVSMHVLAVIPAIVCGIFGGFLGTAFTVFNLKVARMRKTKINPSKSRRFLEVITIMVIYGTIALFLPTAFECTTATDCVYVPTDSATPTFPPEEGGGYFFRCGLPGKNGGYKNIPSNIKAFTCSGVQEVPSANSYPTFTISYNEMASLITTTGEDTIHKLFTRGTDSLFSYSSLFAMLIIYFIAACYTMGSVVAAGVVVPMLLIGGCYGRIVGKICVDIAGGPYARETIWSWIDPGVFALIGAGSFFGGVSRLTLSLTVIMIEISNDIHMLLIMMVTIMVAKWIADYYTHSLYHALIELKCMPFVNDEIPSHSFMDRFLIRDIMQGPVRFIQETALVDDVRALFLTTHSAFPVVEECPEGPVVKGMILKETLLELLRYPEIFFSPGGKPPESRIPYNKIKDTEVSSRFQKRHQDMEMKRAASGNPYVDNEADDYAEDDGLVERDFAEQEDLIRPVGDGVMIDLSPYMDTSAFTVPEKCSVERAYLLFRTMGLRHLPIVDEHNRPVGIVTRKDIQGHDIAHALEHSDDNHHEHGHHA